MTLILDMPGYQGADYKMAFQVSGEHVNEALLLNKGDKVEVGFTIYAREWNGKWYNNVELVKITPLEQGNASAPQEQPIPPAEVVENPGNDLPF
jgi:hypothetical protein